jgi:hypothetical protein
MHRIGLQPNCGRLLLQGRFLLFAGAIYRHGGRGDYLGECLLWRQLQLFAKRPLHS